MNIQDLLERSRQCEDVDLQTIGSTGVDDPLVSIVLSKRLIVEPIWEKPIDELEGPLYKEYIATNPNYDAVYARSELAKRLVVAANSLPTRYTMILRAAHRPIEVQIKLLNMLRDQYASDNPNVSAEEALAYARTFVSDPEVKLPPHCCGAAVDVDMLDNETAQLVDFGCPMNTDGEISYLHSDLVNEVQRANRMMLLEAMLAAGFASFPYEWWHFSYGDQMWAHFYEQPRALYGLIEPDL